MRGMPGRPCSSKGGLQRDPDPYDVNRLIHFFTASSEAFKKAGGAGIRCEDGDKPYKEHRVGQIAGCRLSQIEGVYVWSVSFIHGDSLEYPVEELAHAIRRVHALDTQ